MLAVEQEGEKSYSPLNDSHKALRLWCETLVGFYLDRSIENSLKAHVAHPVTFWEVQQENMQELVYTCFVLFLCVVVFLWAFLKLTCYHNLKLTSRPILWDRDSVLNWAGTSGSGCNSAGDSEEAAQSRPHSILKRFALKFSATAGHFNIWKVGVFIYFSRMA